MSKFDSKAKVITLTALLASTTMVTYASQKALKSTEENAYTAKLVIDKIDKDTVKISLDNITNSAKAFQLSLEVDGDATFNEENIKWLTSENEEEKSINNISNSIKLSDDKKKIDIFVSSDSELKRDGSTLEVCEIDLDKSGIAKNSTYKIIPTTEDGKISYKSVDENNKSLEVESMDYDEDIVLSFNTAPVIRLKTHATLPELDEEESTKESTDNEQIIENSTTPIIDAENSIITISEGYAFNAKSFIEIYDEDESLTLDNVKVTDESGKEITVDEENFKSGTYKRVYTVTDSERESTTLEVDVVVKPEVWETNPTITGVPKDSITIYTGDIFNPLKPDGKTDIVAKDAKGNSLEVKVGGEFSLEEGGNYTLTYTAKDRFDNTTTEEFNLIVIQDNAPVIEGIDDVVINVGTEFNPLDNVRVSDDNKELTLEDLKVSGKVSTNIPGEYTLYYELFDGRNTTKRQRKVTVNGAPTISGDLSYIIVKNGEELSDEQILKGINVVDDIDEEIKSLVVDRGDLNTSVDGKYIVTITATDNSDLSSSVKREILVTSDKVVELTNSGNGLSKEDSIKKQVIDGSAVENINKELSDLTKDNEVTLSKTNILENVIYSIKVSPNKIAFRQVQNEYFVDITVPKAIDEATGGIVITKYEAIKISSININENDGEMKIGDEIVLNATILPEDAENKDLLWVSTNSDIVSIVPSADSQSATIKALKKGTSTIRVMATDGSGQYKELVVKVGEQPKEDTEAPVFDYKGKTDIVVANGMKFETPLVNASDNVDTGIKVNVYITNEEGLNVEEIDTTKAGKYKILYTAKDKSENKAELTINVTVKEAISGIEVGSGNAINDEQPLAINILTEVEGLNKLLEAIKEDGYEPKIYGEPIIDQINNEITYIMKIYKKQNFFAKLFNFNENDEVYYLKIKVKNTDEVNDVLNKIDKEDVQLPEEPETPELPEQQEDTEAPVFNYEGKTDMIVVNGMNFKIPEITATDNVDTEIIVDVSITDEEGLKLEEIDTTKAGKYKIVYTAKDKAGNESELTINVTVKEAISGVVIGTGNATTQEQALEINISKDVEGLNKLLSLISKDGFEPKIYGNPIISEDNSEITYIVKIYKKQGFFAKLFNLDKNEEVYYLKLTVKNTDEFNSILNKIDKEGVEVPEQPETPEVPEVPETPEVPEVPETPEVPEVPETPEVPEVPETPEVPEVPETPEVPEEPETPEVPEVPETPEVPEVPETPEVPEQPETPEVPEVPETPEVPEEPETPEVPEVPETPEVPEQPETPEDGTEDIEAPIFKYEGKKDIVVANGMRFEIPQIIATDNVDTEIIVDVSITDENGLKLEEIDTTKAGKYKIVYTAKDKAGNESKLTINITVKEAISGVIIGNGSAITQEQALEINISKDVEGLNKLLALINKDGFEPKIYGNPILSEDNSEITYIVKIYKKENFFAKILNIFKMFNIFNINENEEVYYLKLTVKNTDEFNSILDQIDKEGVEVPEQPETPEVPEQPETPEVPEQPETPEVPEQPETPEAPEQPETPEVPEQPETPEAPEQPETPEVPEQPETPEVPEQPETPEVPEQPETPEVPEEPETPEDSKDPVVPDKPKEDESVIIIPGDNNEIDDSKNSSEQEQLVAQDSQKYDTEDTKDSNEKVDSNKVENKPVDSNELENIEDNTDENTVDTSNRNILGYLGLAGSALVILFIFVKNKIKKNK